MKLSKQDKVILAKVIDESTLNLMRGIAGALVANWNDATVIYDTEHQTVVAAVRKEERKNALDIFLQELERLAHE